MRDNPRGDWRGRQSVVSFCQSLCAKTLAVNHKTKPVHRFKAAIKT
jgi:hypothetical protein